MLMNEKLSIPCSGLFGPFVSLRSRFLSIHFFSDFAKKEKKSWGWFHFQTLYFELPMTIFAINDIAFSFLFMIFSHFARLLAEAWFIR